MKKCPVCGELNGDNVSKCFSCFFDFTKEEEIVEQIGKEKLATIFDKNDRYVYDAVSLSASKSGAIDTNELVKTLNNKAAEGWRLVSSFGNEADYSPASTSSSNQKVLIFEKCVYRYKR